MKLKIRLLEDNSHDFIGDYTLESNDKTMSFGLNVRILACDVNRLKHFSQPNGRSLLSFRTYFAILSFRCLRFFKLGIISSGFTWIIRPPNEFRTSCSVLNDNGWTTVSSPRAIVQLEFGLISLFGVKFKSISFFISSISASENLFRSMKVFNISFEFFWSRTSSKLSRLSSSAKDELSNSTG